MGEWMQRAALIEDEPAPSRQRRLSDAGAASEPPTPENIQPEPDYCQHPDRYEFPRFTILTVDGPVEFRLTVPKEKYDAFVILDLFIKHHGKESSTASG